MSFQEAADTTIVDHEEIFKKIDNYPWESDEEFQSGLSAILGSNADPEQIASLTLRARCFYYSRKYNVAIDFPAYQAWHARHSQTPVDSSNGTKAVTEEHNSLENDTSDLSSEGKPPYPVSFTSIVELITTGQPIPGIKEIPPTVLEGQESQSTGARRKKPWEKDSDKTLESGVINTINES